LTHLGIVEAGADPSTLLTQPLPIGTYPVTVRFAGIWHQEPTSVAMPVREPRESAAAFRARCDVVEQRRIARSRHEGLHVASYPLPMGQWRAHDLDRVMGLAYSLLPSSEPRWRQSGTIVRRPLRDGEPGARRRRGRSPWPPCISSLEVGRGEYVSSLWLPGFPARAMVDWLGRRPCEISLCHAVDLLEKDAGTPSLWPRPRGRALRLGWRRRRRSPSSQTAA